jgi:hypothetical protein
MSLNYLTGSRFNLYKRGTVSVSPTAATVAPAAGLYDDDPSLPHIAGSIAADSYMRVQHNALTNPGFETAGLVGWTDASSGAGSRADSTTTPRTGSRCLQLTAVAGDPGASYQDITVTAGELRKATLYAFDASGGGSAKLYLQNLKTGNYWSGGVWGASVAPAVSLLSGAGAYAVMTATYTVEDYDTCRSDTVSIRWKVQTNIGTWRIDDCLDVPGVTFASIHGHNYGNVISPLVQSSDDGAAWTTRATMTIRRPAFFSSFSIIYAEYWQIKLSGTPHEAPYTGEAVLGQYQTSATAPKWGLADSRDFPGVRMAGPSKRPSAYNFATDPPESIAMEFSPRTAAAALEIANLWLRSGQGLYPTIIVPIDTEAFVYYGRLLDPREQSRPFQGIADVKLNLVGDPFPTIGL